MTESGNATDNRDPEPSSVSFVLVFSEYDQDAPEIISTYSDEILGGPHEFELIVVNNGLGAGFNELVKPVVRTKVPHGQIIHLHEAADESTALTQGLRACSRDIVVVLPSYIQIDPTAIRPMIQQVESGELDCVASWRDPRCDRRAAATTSRVFNSLARKITGCDLHDVSTTLRVMRRRIVEDVPVYGDLYRFLPALVAKRGYRVGEMKVRHVSERVRKGDYRMGVFVRRLLDLLSLFFITKFTNKPLRLFGLVGGAVLIAGLLITATTTIQWFLGQPLSDRPMLVFGVVLIVLGAQLFSIGLIGELIIFTHSREMKEYHVDQVYESRTCETSEAIDVHDLDDIHLHVQTEMTELIDP